MKKIININLSGMVIPIEDSAYNTLQHYIESLRHYFRNEEGRDEIINDIESRMAELMNDKIKKGAHAITDVDIESIISSMGRVEDFETADLETEGDTTQTGANSNRSEQYAETDKKIRGRLYRDLNDKYIGGVCSGIANYFNIDPAIVRLIVLLLIFAGGTGVLAYIVLWILVPAKDLDSSLGKRLYRNPDDRMLGGVAGGLAAYFDKSTTSIRLIFAAPLVLNIIFSLFNHVVWWSIGFGSLTGTFILVYVILWIILPEAHTTYEKMEMRGETVDINRIRQNVREGMGPIKERMKEWGEEVKETAQNLSEKATAFSSTSGRRFASEVNETVRRRSSGIGHAIAVLFKVFFLFIAGVVCFAIFMGLITLIFGGVAWWPINNYLWTSNWQQLLAWGTLIFFFLTPLIAFVTWIVRRIAKVKTRKSYLGWIFGGLWTLGWIVMILFVTSVSKDFRQLEHADHEIMVTQPANGKMIVAVSQPEIEFSGSFGWLNNGDNHGWDLSAEKLKIAAIKFNVIASTDQLYRVTVNKYSAGRTEEDALSRAEKIQYEVHSIDSVLDLGNAYTIFSNDKFRGQHVQVEIQVPIGKKIRFDESVTDKLTEVNFRINRRYRGRNNWNTEFRLEDDYRFRFNTNVDYVMDMNGKLKRVGGEVEEDNAPVNDNQNSVPTQEGQKTEPTDDYRYKKPKTDSIEIEKNIEQKKLELQELEKRKEEIKKSATMLELKPTIQKQGQALAKGPSPVNAMAQWF